MRDLNKRARHVEIVAHLRKHGVSCAGLLETRVKNSKSNNIRKVFGNNWKWIGNYEARDNERVWFGWNPHIMDVIKVAGTN